MIRIVRKKTKRAVINLAADLRNKGELGKRWLRFRLDHYGRLGVEALKTATPKRTGKTSESWSYEIRMEEGSQSIIWTNSNVNKGENIAILIQYGHGTRNGGYVKGIDYINPALRPIFEKIADSVYKEVISL